MGGVGMGSILGNKKKAVSMVVVVAIAAILVSSVLISYTAEAKTKTKTQTVHVDIEDAEHGMDSLKLCPSFHGKNVGDCKVVNIGKLFDDKQAVVILKIKAKGNIVENDYKVCVSPAKNAVFGSGCIPIYQGSKGYYYATIDVTGLSAFNSKTANVRTYLDGLGPGLGKGLQYLYDDSQHFFVSQSNIDFDKLYNQCNDGGNCFLYTEFSTTSLKPGDGITSCASQESSGKYDCSDDFVFQKGKTGYEAGGPIDVSNFDRNG